MSYFDSAFQIVVGLEGGYVDDPNDPGGATKYGISQRAYPDLQISTLTLDQAKAIYLRDYWTPLALDTTPWGVSLMLFDCAVNQGLAFAKTLPRSVTQIAASRAMRYAQNPRLAIYGRGWFLRLFTIYFKATQTTPA